MRTRGGATTRRPSTRFGGQRGNASPSPGGLAGVGSPLQTLCELVGGERAARAAAAKHRCGRFVKPGPEDVAAYTTELLTATQTTRNPARDLDGQHLGARNKFGVTLLHKALRFPNWRAARHLLSVRPDLANARDDLGRAPLHDACWNEQLDWSAVDALLARDPCQLLCADNRGHTPLCYAPQCSWRAWAQFLQSRRGFLEWAFDADRDACSEAPDDILSLLPSRDPVVSEPSSDSDGGGPPVKRPRVAEEPPPPPPQTSPQRRSPAQRWTEVARSVLLAHCPRYAPDRPAQTPANSPPRDGRALPAPLPPP